MLARRISDDIMRAIRDLFIVFLKGLFHFYPRLPFILIFCFYEFNIDGWFVFSFKNFWPFYETNVFGIIENLFSSDIHEIIVRLESIEIKMVNIFISIIISIGRAFYCHFLTKERRNKLSRDCCFSCPKISSEKYPIPYLRKDRKRREIFFCENI